MASEDLIDGDDWVEIERTSRTATPATEVSVKITVCAPGRFAAKPKPRATVLFRGKAAEWLAAHGPRFRLAVGGADANRVRIVPDINRGKFEAHPPPGASETSTSLRFNLGVVDAWPAETRDATAASWQIGDGFMDLSLPADFARARGTVAIDNRPREFCRDEPERPAPLIARYAEPPVAPKPPGDQAALAAARDVLNRAVVPPAPATPPAARVVAAPASAPPAPVKAAPPAPAPHKPPSVIAQRVAAAKPAPAKPERRVVKSFEDLDPYAHLRDAR